MNTARLAELYRAHARLVGELARVEGEIADELDPKLAPAPKRHPRPTFVAPEGVSDLDRERARRRLEGKGYSVRGRRANR